MFVVYRVYFRGMALDTNLFPPTPTRVIDVPDKKTADLGNKGENNAEVEQATPPRVVDVLVPDRSQLISAEQ